MVKPTGKADEVLLDENLLDGEPSGIFCTLLTRQSCGKQPFFMREHAKRALRSALNSDCEFYTRALVLT